MKDTSLFLDLPGFLSPCIITGEQFRPDRIFSTASNILYIIEFTVGFEVNIYNNASRQYEEYHSLKQEISSNYHEVKFTNVSISSLGIFGHLKYILKTLITIIIYAAYYIFCALNKPWTTPELLTY